MAIITPSAQISEIRGSVGDQTFSRNHYRAYTKTRKAPTDTPSSYKTTARNNFAQIAPLWQALSDNQRKLWNTASGAFMSRSRLGKLTDLDGYNYFARFNMYLLTAGESDTQTPGVPTNMPRFTTYLVTASSSGVGFTYRVSFSNSNLRLLCYASAPVSPGKMSVNSTALAFMVAGPTFSGVNVQDFSTEWSDRFGDPGDFTGQKVFFGTRIFDVSSGSVSPMRTASTIIT